MEKNYVSMDTLVGKQVIDSNAIIVGNIKEVTFDTYLKTIALNVAYKKGKVIAIEDNNMTIGDVVLLTIQDLIKPKKLVHTKKGTDTL